LRTTWAEKCLSILNNIALFWAQTKSMTVTYKIWSMVLYPEPG